MLKTIENIHPEELSNLPKQNEKILAKTKVIL
jgi:hypothetical protein